jgi:co-chaperonin GroES (HSP10)
MHTPINKLIVRLEKKLYDSRTFESGQTIYFDPTWQPEEYAMLKAKVVSVPPGVIDRPDYHGYTICIQPGDEILIRYDVVFAYKDQPDRDTPIYKNLIFQYDEREQRYEELWLCDILQVFAIVRGGEYHMINGFVMLSIVKEFKEDTKWLIVPDNYQEVESKNMAIVMAAGQSSIVRPGNQVYINSQMVMKYQLNLEKFYITKEQYILGRIE